MGKVTPGVATVEPDQAIRNRTDVISADDHVQVSHDQVKRRLPSDLHAAYDDAVAAVGAEIMMHSGGKLMLLDSWRYEALGRPGYSNPVERLADMDRDGIAAQVLYSELSGFRFFHRVPGKSGEVARALNDTLQEFASVDPRRLLCAYQLDLSDIDSAVAEVERLAGLGARAVHLPNYPNEQDFPEYFDPYYDRLWGVLQETGIPVHHHLGNKRVMWDVFRRDPTPQGGVYNALNQMALAECLGFWLLTGPLVKFPGLRLVLVESGLSWIPFYLDTLDRRAKGPFEFPELKELPSHYFKEQVSVTFFDDALGVELRSRLGVENIMWSSDYPHPDTTWPNSQAAIDRQFVGVPDDERFKMTYGNAARLYGLDT